MQDAPIMRPCRTFKGHTTAAVLNEVTSILHLPGGQRIMAGSADGSLRVWNLQTGRQIYVWRMRNFSVRSISLSPNGKKVAIGGWGGLLGFYDVDTGKVNIDIDGEIGGPGRLVGWNRDGRRVITIGPLSFHNDPPAFTSVARVWDLESKKTVLEIESRQLESAIYSPDMTMIAGGEYSPADFSKDTFIKIWDANTGKLVANLKGHKGNVYCLAWTADGSTLISGSFDRSVRTWDTSTWHQITVLTPHTGPIRDIAIHPTAHILASASWDGTARLCNLENRQPIGPPLQHADNVHCVSFSTDGNLLATGCWNNNAYTWDISSILSNAGLVSNPSGAHHQSLLDAETAQLAGRRHKNSTHRLLHPDFFQETPRHPDPSRSSRVLPTSVRHETTSQSRFLAWTRNPFFDRSHRRNDKDTELQGGLSTVVDVPLGRRKHMYYSANEVRIKEEKEKEKEKEKRRARATKNGSVSSAGQLPAGVRHAQTSETHTTASISPSTPVVIGAPTATMSATSLTDDNVPQSRRWARFICCS